MEDEAVVFSAVVLKSYHEQLTQHTLGWRSVERWLVWLRESSQTWLSHRINEVTNYKCRCLGSKSNRTLTSVFDGAAPYSVLVTSSAGATCGRSPELGQDLYGGYIRKWGDPRGREAERQLELRSSHNSWREGEKEMPGIWVITAGLHGEEMTKRTESYETNKHCHVSGPGQRHNKHLIFFSPFLFLLSPGTDGSGPHGIMNQSVLTYAANRTCISFKIRSSVLSAYDFILYSKNISLS